MASGWEQVAPGVWRCTEPIDQAAASALMEERLRLRAGETAGQPRRAATPLDILARLLCWAAVGVVATLLVLAVINA